MENGNAAMPKVWVVIPIHNAEKTLAKCLDSLVRQTLTQWTACLIDDGSTDGSAEVVRRYTERDDRFQWIALKRNGGPSAARNLGLGASCAEYIAFLDSDDWWADDFLEKMVAAIEETGADFVQCAWTLEWPGGLSRAEENTYRTQRVFDRPDFGKPLTRMLTGISMNHVARKLVRRKLTDGLKFSAELPTAEDLWMCFQLLMKARRIVFIPEPLYHYYRHGAGLTGGGLKFRQKWRANREVSTRMIRELRGSEFNRLRYRVFAWLRPYLLVVPKAIRMLRDKQCADLDAHTTTHKAQSSIID